MKTPDRTQREGRFLALTTSINLPSNLLSETDGRATARYNKVGTADPYRHSATLDLTSSNFHAFTADRQERRERYVPTYPAQDSGKKWIVEKEHNQRQESLAKRLKNMRVQNDVLENFSLSKLLSKIKVLKDSEQRYEDLPSFASVIRKPPQKKAVKPRNFKFKELSQRSQYSPPGKSPQLSPRRIQQEDSSKIFKRYYCPPNSYRDPAFFREISPQDKYIYRDGKKVECKRIHNFYTSHMYKRGYSRHYRKLEDEEDFIETLCGTAEISSRLIK